MATGREIESIWRIQTEEEIEILENTNWGRDWNFGEYKLRKILKFWRIQTEEDIEILENKNWERDWNFGEYKLRKKLKMKNWYGNLDLGKIGESKPKLSQFVE